MALELRTISSVPKRQRRHPEPVFDIETRVLRAVIALAERLSFTRTARKLHISQPALSKQIAELEERFEFPLFTRTNKRVVDLPTRDVSWWKGHIRWWLKWSWLFDSLATRIRGIAIS
jgi:hypothetical protein